MCALSVFVCVPLLGIASFGGNTFYERCLLFITEKRLRGARKLPFTGGEASESTPGRVNGRIIKRFTLVQLVILLCIFAITQLPFVGASFPLLIAVLVPLRMYGLPRLFGKYVVDALDFKGGEPVPQGEDGAEPEVIVIQQAHPSSLSAQDSARAADAAQALTPLEMPL